MEWIETIFGHGTSPFIPTAVGCLAFVLVHWLLARLSFYSDWGGTERSVLLRKNNTSL